MKHQPPNGFMATPQRGRGQSTEADINRKLNQRFGPQDRARADALRLDSDPRSLTEAFAAEIDQSLRGHHAVVRSEALAAIAANTDVIGVLTIAVQPEEVPHRVQTAETQLERVFTERRKDADRACESLRHGLTAFDAWADSSGAKLRMAPWPTAGYFALVVCVAMLAETWLVSQVLSGPPIMGVPPPLLLGLIFAGGSLFVGTMAALGHMLAAEARTFLRSTGWIVLALALLAWAVLCLMGAHMRATIEDGGGGTVPEIFASIRGGLFRPLVSPLALLLAAASTATAAAVWMKTLGYFGIPFGHRQHDEERRWCVRQFQEAEEAHKAAIRATAANAVDELDTLVVVAWKPANDAVRLEREVLLIIAEARESERAIHRAHAGQLTVYGNTFRRIRPDAQITNLLKLDPTADDIVSDPMTLRTQIEALECAAGQVTSAANRGKLRLHAVEVAHLTKVDALYANPRSRRTGHALTPA